MTARSIAIVSSEPALFLAEAIGDLNEGANFLAQLSSEVWETLRRKGTQVTIKAGSSVFLQGDQHEGIWLIEDGVVRTFYAAPSGREITLAYWTAGHFVGGPEIFGGGQHIWSADVMQTCRLLYLPAGAIRSLIQTQPSFALCLIEGLVAKGKCYSALAQMLGTRSVVERLAQLLVILAENHGRREGNRLFIERKITHDQIATIVGATRQWVTITLDKFQKKGIITVARQSIVIERYDLLMAQVGSD
ncbi:cyclic nucleotide-binding protein [Pseudorhodoplanes sinuspersici]|uniref:Cyclic nucleotide-binding protein n=2 Tax=Pseudorhodoplanes sinuspersici TaxID=1235591 RepID=A0A1W6ZLZ9_9HYPH|nr:Crp/Fnr family transcriptional regulator [Pseudorhodoplanes sinuspersici]ARP98305.1 cyclic nucleotide-binding protein [Pseudorhodoplanes sinuspersici]